MFRLQKTPQWAIEVRPGEVGLGIKDEDKEKLFKAFGRLDQKDKNVNVNGVGLGLNISNILATLLNPAKGHGIQVQSQIGKGSIFSFVVESYDVDVSEESQNNVSLDERDEDDGHRVPHRR